MKTLPLLSLATLVVVLAQPAHARDRISVGIGISAAPIWGSYYSSYSSAPYYYDRGCAPQHYYRAPYPVYATPVYSAPVYVAPAPVYASPVYYPPAYAPTAISQPAQAVPVAPQYQYQPIPVDGRLIQVQSALRQRKYYLGAIDGISGPATQAAIRAYQVDRGLPVTGKVDSELTSDLGL